MSIAGLSDRLVRQLYRGKAWVEHFAETSYAEPALFLAAFIEASVFPVPPDLLLVALGVSRPRRSFRYGAVGVAGSTLGAMAGYAIGRFVFEGVGNVIIGWLGVGHHIDDILFAYRDHAWWTVIGAGFSNLPFSLFSILAGFHQTLDPITFFLAALTGRSIRFGLLAGLLFFLGRRVKDFIERRLPLIAFGLLVMTILVIAGIRLSAR